MEHKKNLRKIVISIVAILTSLFLITGIAMGQILHLSYWNITLVLCAILGACIIGGIIGWIFLRAILSQLFNVGEKSEIITNSQEKLGEKMSLDYELDIDDVLSYYSYNYAQHLRLGIAQKLIRLALLFAVAIEILVVIFLGMSFGNDYLTIILIISSFALLTLLYYIFYSSLMKKVLKIIVVRNFQGNNRLTGKHKFSIYSDGIIDITAIGESKIYWSGIKQIVSTDQYMFITIPGSSPFIVPLKAFTDETSFRRFIDKAKSYYQAAMEANNPTFTPNSKLPF